MSRCAVAVCDPLALTVVLSGKLSYKVAYSTEPLMGVADMEEERQSQTEYQPVPVEPPPMQTYAYYPQQYQMNVFDAPSQMHLQQMQMPTANPGGYLMQGPQMAPQPPPPPPMPNQRPMMTPGDLAAVQQHASMYYASNQHDQRQLDELVERLAYESSPSPAPGGMPNGSMAPPGTFEYASPPSYVSHPPYHLTPPAPGPYYPQSVPQQTPSYWYEPMPGPPPPQPPGMCPMMPYGPMQPPAQPPVMHLNQHRPVQQLMPVVTSSHMAMQPLMMGNAKGEQNVLRKSPTEQKELNDSMCSLEDSTPVKQMMVAMGMKTEGDNKSSFVDVNNNVTSAASLAPPSFEDPISPGAKSDKSLSALANSGAVYKLNAVNLPPAVFSQEGSVKTEAAESGVVTSDVECIIGELKLESNGDNEGLSAVTSAKQVSDRPSFSSLRTN